MEERGQRASLHVDVPVKSRQVQMAAHLAVWQEAVVLAEVKRCDVDSRTASVLCARENPAHAALRERTVTLLGSCKVHLSILLGEDCICKRK